MQLPYAFEMQCWNQIFEFEVRSLNKPERVREPQRGMLRTKQPTALYNENICLSMEVSAVSHVCDDAFQVIHIWW